jgi:hypothetical protein
MKKLILAGLTLAAAACGGTEGTGPNPNPEPSTGVAGIYVLDNIENHDVPYNYDSKSVTGGTVKAYWLSGQLELRADQSFTLKLVSKVTGPGHLGLPNTQTWNGTWAAETGGVKLTHSSGVAHYSFSGNNTELNMVANYTKMSGEPATLGFTFKKQ